MHALDRRATKRCAVNLAIAGLTGLFILTGSAGATDRVWIGTFGDGDGVTYADPLNWFPSGVPGLSDTAIFNFVPANVYMPGGLVINDRLIVAEGGVAVTFDMQGGVFRLNSAAASGTARSLVVDGGSGGGKSDGTVLLTNGSVLAKHAVVGAGPESDGTLRIADDGSLQTTQTFTIGEAGTGDVDVFGELITGPLALGVEPSGDGVLWAGDENAIVLALGDMTTGAGYAHINIQQSALLAIFGDASLATSAKGGALLQLVGLGTSAIIEGDLTIGGTQAAAGGTASFNLAGPATGRIDGTLRSWPGGYLLQQPGSRVDATALEFNGGQANVEDGATLVLGALGADTGPGLFAGLEESTETTTIEILDGAVLHAAFVELGSGVGSRTATQVSGANSFLDIAGDLRLGWEPVPFPPAGGDASLLVSGGSGLGIGGELLVRQGGVLSVDGATVFTQQLTITDHGVLEGTLFGDAGTTLVDAVGATVGGGLLIGQADPATLPSLGVNYNAVRTFAGGNIDGAFAVILAQPLPAFRYYKFNAPPSKDDAGKGPSFVSLEVDKLDSILGLTEVVPVPLDGSPNKIVAGIFDSDALPDAFVTIPGEGGAPGQGALLLNGAGKNAAGGGFEVAATIPIGGDPSGLTRGSFNDDSQGDFAVSDADAGTIQIIYNTSTSFVGGLSAGPILSVGGRPRGVMTADFNNDRRDDLVWVDPTTNEVKTADGEGDGKFGEPEAATSGPQPASVCPLDLDNDKDIDVAVANAGEGAAFAGAPQGSSVAILMNMNKQGGEGFEKAVLYPVGDGAIALAEADLNRDGFVDIVTANSIAGTVSVLIGKSGGTFFPAVDLPAGGFPFDIAAGDFDNDSGKDIDLAVLVRDDKGEPGLTVFRNDSTGGQCVLTIFENAEMLIGLPQAITSADTDGDGPSDLVFVGDFGDGSGEGYVSVIESDPITCPADADGDGSADGNDLGGLLSAWGQQGESIYDLNGDGAVNGVDLSILLAGWGPCDLGGEK